MSSVADRSNKRKNLELTVGFSIMGSLVAFGKNSFFGTVRMNVALAWHQEIKERNRKP